MYIECLLSVQDSTQARLSKTLATQPSIEHEISCTVFGSVGYRKASHLLYELHFGDVKTCVFKFLTLHLVNNRISLSATL